MRNPLLFFISIASSILFVFASSVWAADVSKPLAEDTTVGKTQPAAAPSKEESEASPKEEEGREKSGETAGSEDGEERSSESGEDEGKKNRMRFTIFGAAWLPSSDKGEEASAGLGGFIGYDFFDTIGVELLLDQIWAQTKLAGRTYDLKILNVRPGLRYRFYSDSFRLHVMAHAGMIQVYFPQKGDTDKYRESYGGDAGFGGEFLFSDFLLVDLFAMYEAAPDCMPRNKAGKAGLYHGIFIGLGLGISSEMN